MDGGGTSQNGMAPSFNPTIPWESASGSSGQPQIADPKFESPVKIAQDAYSMFQGSGKMMGIIGVAVAAVKIGYQLVKTATPFIQSETGDFGLSISLSNYESWKNSVFHPVQTTINYFRNQQQDRLANQRTAMKLELLGDSEINSYIDKGY